MNNKELKVPLEEVFKLARSKTLKQDLENIADVEKRRNTLTKYLYKAFSTKYSERKLGIISDNLDPLCHAYQRVSGIDLGYISNGKILNLRTKDLILVKH